MTKILDAIKQDNFNQAERLISIGEPVNAQDQAGITALHLAILKQNLDMIHLLLQAGSDPNAKIINDNIELEPKNLNNSNMQNKTIDRIKLKSLMLNQLQNLGNKTPLHIAAKNNLIETGKLLIAYDANPNITDSGLCTPLHWAAAKGYSDFVSLLLSNHANPNVQDLANSTPLHEATRNHYPIVIKILLKYQARYDLVDMTNKTAFDIAKEKPTLVKIYQHHCNQVFH